RLSNTLVARQRLLASSYQEAGRQLLLEGRPLEAVPYLVEARKVSSFGAPLRMLFSPARRSLLASIEHRGWVLTAQSSPDGRRLVTASTDRTARVWNTTTGEPVSPPLVHHDVVRSAAFSPDGARVITASDDLTARIWDAVTGVSHTVALEHQAPV